MNGKHHIIKTRNNNKIYSKIPRIPVWKYDNVILAKNEMNEAPREEISFGAFSMQ